MMILLLKYEVINIIKLFNFEKKCYKYMNIFTIKIIMHKIFKEIIMTYQHLEISRLFILYYSDMHKKIRKYVLQSCTLYY